MTTPASYVKSGIYSLLSLDPADRKSEAIAVARLARLGIGGKPCRHCDGDTACISCRGAGVVDIKLTEDTLIELREAAHSTAFIKAQMIWRAVDLAQTFQKQLNAQIEATGIRKAFNAEKAQQEPKGSWNRDLYEINLNNVRACKLATADVHSLSALDNEQQFQWAYEYLHRTQQAELLVMKTEQRFHEYVDRAVCA